VAARAAANAAADVYLADNGFNEEKILTSRQSES